MIDNVSYASYLKVFLDESECTSGFDPIFPFSLVTSHTLLCFLLSHLKTEVDMGIVAFHITFRELLYCHILFRGAGVSTIGIFRCWY